MTTEVSTPLASPLCARVICAVAAVVLHRLALKRRRDEPGWPRCGFAGCGPENLWPCPPEACVYRGYREVLDLFVVSAAIVVEARSESTGFGVHVVVDS